MAVPKAEIGSIGAEVAGAVNPGATLGGGMPELSGVKSAMGAGDYRGGMEQFASTAPTFSPDAAISKVDLTGPGGKSPDFGAPTALPVEKAPAPAAGGAPPGGPEDPNRGAVIDMATRQRIDVPPAAVEQVPPAARPDAGPPVADAARPGGGAEAAQPAGQAGPVAPENAGPNAQPDAKHFDDQENRLRQGEDLQVAHGEMTAQQRDQARAERAVAAQQEASEKQKARHQELKGMEASGKPMTLEQHKELGELNKQEQARKTDYEQLKERQSKGENLNDDEIKKLEQLRGEFNPEKQPTPEDLKQQEQQLMNEIVSGKDVVNNLKKLGELRDKRDGETQKITPEETKAIVDKIMNPDLEHSEQQKLIRENILEMIRIETQLVSQGLILDQLRKERSAAIAEAKKAKLQDVDPNGKDPNAVLENNRQVYDKYLAVWQIKSKITYTKLNAGRLVAEYNDKKQFVRRKLGISGPIDSIVSFVGAKAGLVGAEAMYKVDSVLSESALDDDEPGSVAWNLAA